MEFIWDDIVLAVDVCPESCEVCTRGEVCRQRIEAALAATREQQRRNQQSDTQEKSTRGLGLCPEHLHPSSPRPRYPGRRGHHRLRVPPRYPPSRCDRWCSGLDT